MRLWAKLLALVAIAAGIQVWAERHPDQLEDSLFTLRVAMWRPPYEQPSDEAVDAARQVMDRRMARYARDAGRRGGGTAEG